MEADRVKRILRDLKKKELRMIRGFLGVENVSMPLVWNQFFELKKPYKGRARYTFDDVLCMTDKVFEDLMDEYFNAIVNRFFCEEVNNIHPVLKLPADADFEAVKKRFRELAKIAHPDVGGTQEEFLALYEAYEEFKNRY